MSRKLNGKLKQGQGPGTPLKEETIGSYLMVNMRVHGAGARKAKYPKTYVHWDLNCGSGYNERAGCEGSPVLAYEMALGLGIDFRMGFCDNNPECIRKLKTLPLAKDPRVTIIEADNETIFPQIIDMINAANRNPRYTLGTILHDPNGALYKKGVVFGLMQISQLFPKIDIILNSQVRFCQKVHGCLRANPEKWVNAYKYFTHPRDCEAQFNKRFSVVGVRTPPKGERYITQILRNFHTGGHRRLGLYLSIEPIGRRMLEDLCSAEEAAARLRAEGKDTGRKPLQLSLVTPRGRELK